MSARYLMVNLKSNRVSVWSSVSTEY